MRNTAARHTDKDGKFNVSAKNQKDWSGLYLPKNIRDKLFDSIFIKFREALQEKFSGFECFPPPAKIALMDMIFNIGATKFSLGKWPNLFTAVNQRNWSRAAHESDRSIPNGDNKRNDDTHRQFLDAATMESTSQEDNQSRPLRE